MSTDREQTAQINALALRVATLERQLAAVFEHLNITPLKADAPLDQIAELVRTGNKIEAIAQYRKLHGCGLAEAKTAVEQLAAQLGFV